MHFHLHYSCVGLLSQALCRVLKRYDDCIAAIGLWLHATALYSLMHNSSRLQNIATNRPQRSCTIENIFPLMGWWLHSPDEYIEMFCSSSQSLENVLQGNESMVYNAPARGACWLELSFSRFILSLGSSPTGVHPSWTWDVWNELWFCWMDKMCR